MSPQAPLQPHFNRSREEELELGQLREHLPAVLEIHRRGWGILQLSELADGIRSKHDGEPEWRIRRLIRDAMIDMKQGPDDTAEHEPVAVE